ncbi:FAD-dependent oxidoreductase [Nonomuraea sp. NPDC049158]|uniref:FAD-dependent oxidoreductase n=1 Tax=Nonomuraea sp. NPDC049158 TaxID=3155649 RepID=UPI0033EFC9A7
MSGQDQASAVLYADSDDVPWDETVDVAVAGSGAAGWSAAIAAASAGASVVVLEKADVVGGTTAKAGGVCDGERAGTWLWICDNPLMAARGIEDPREDAIRYLARLAQPSLYRPEAPHLGLDAADHELLEAFYDHGRQVVRALADDGVLDFLIVPDVLDYYSDLPENAASHGRTLGFRVADAKEGIGAELVQALEGKALGLGVTLRLRCAVRAVVVDDNTGEVAGVLAGDRAATSRLIRTRGGVVFATGGFGSSPHLRREFLRGPVVASLSCAGNVGDFLPIAFRLGAAMGNMNEGWLTPVVLDHAHDPASGAFRLPGDSMLVVNRRGHRVVNEKATYNEMTRAFFHWDATTAEYPNIPLIMIYDEWVARHCRQLPGDAPVTEGGGNPIPVQGRDDKHELSAATLDDLADAIGRHLDQYSGLLAGARLAPDFRAALRRTIDAYNADAAAGQDRDFGRGSSRVQRARSGPSHHSTGANPTMHPLATTGPYHAVVLVPGVFDTKGGPKIDKYGRIRTHDGGVINGLYGAGNCVASIAGQGYWGGGTTLGLAVTFGYLAGQHAAGRG